MSDWMNRLFSRSDPNLKLEVPLYRFLNSLSRRFSIFFPWGVCELGVPEGLISLPITRGI